MAVFVKLFSGLVYSTVWQEALHVKVVWITMLAMCDSKGRVYSSVPGLASASGVSIEQCRETLEKLKAPDPYSRTRDHEGRRIEEIDGGWLVLNYLKYREMRDEDKRLEQTRQAMRRYRQKGGGGKKKLTPAHHNNGERGEPRLAQEEEEEEGRTTSERADVTSSLTASSATGSPLVDDPLFLKAHAAEKAIRLSTDALRTKLYALVQQMVKADPQRRDPTELMRLVTAYEREGKLVGGVVNASLLSHERVEKSIEDAEWQLAEWAKEPGDGA